MYTEIHDDIHTLTKTLNTVVLQMAQWLGLETRDLWVWYVAMTIPGYFRDRWPSLASKLSWDITTAQVNSALHPFVVAKLSTSFGWVKGGKVIAAGWQVRPCDPIWHVISRSSEVISIIYCYICFALLYMSNCSKTTNYLVSYQQP